MVDLEFAKKSLLARKEKAEQINNMASKLAAAFQDSLDIFHNIPNKIFVDHSIDPYLEKIKNKENKCLWWINEIERKNLLRLLPKEKQWKEKIFILKKFSTIPDGGFIGSGSSILFSHKKGPVDCNAIIITLEEQKILEAKKFPGIFSSLS